MIIRGRVRPVSKLSEEERLWDRFMILNARVNRQHEAYQRASKLKASGDPASGARILRAAGIAEEVIDGWLLMPPTEGK